ncbi:MAG: TetR/AcrR family transcriptional regulator [Robiginitomaculum sp.]|nr:TetR/AcrR family transcriptional regulator [Robiginitomaculum sp.]
MARFTKTDWLDLGLQSLATDGPAALRIDMLCTAAGRTKGSFYHHFSGREDFTTALLNHWEQKLTEAVIDETEHETDPVEKLIALNRITDELDMGVETALRRWAGTEPGVAASIAKVDKRRIDYVASLLMQAKDISVQKAVDLAVMNYAGLIGTQLMFTDISRERRKRIARIYVDMLDMLPDHTD